MEVFKKSEFYLEFKNEVLNIRQKYPFMGRKKFKFSNPYYLEYPIDNNEEENYHSKVLGIGIVLAINFCGIILDSKKIPMQMIVNRRILGKFNFSNVVGDMHDYIPILFDTADTEQRAIEKRIRMDNHLSEQGLYFIGIAELDDEIGDLVFAAPILFNYVGEGYLDYKLPPLPITNHYDIWMEFEKKSNTIRLLLNNGIDHKKIDPVRNYLDINTEGYSLIEA